jgi:hypothetical protein
MLAWGKPTERQRALAQPQVYALLAELDAEAPAFLESTLPSIAGGI